MPVENAAKLFDQLDVKHPDYIEWEDEWTRYRDVLGDRLVEAKTYLPKNKFEPQPQYDFRLEISQFIPESGLAIERLLGALFNEKPKREFTGNTKELETFVEKATRKGESWNVAIEMVAFHLMGYGSTRCLVNVPPAELPDKADGTVAEPPGQLTRKEEQDLDVRPYLTNYTPLSVVDWEHDEHGVLVFVRIKEERTVKAPGTNKLSPHKKQTRFIEYDRQEVRWWLFEDDDSENAEKRTLVDKQTKNHDLGMVPMVVEELREIKSFVGSSFVRYSSKADIRKHQAESDLAYDTYLHAHPFLAIWTEDELKEIGVGSTTYLKLHPGTGGAGREDASYVEAPTSAFEALMMVINENRTQIFRQAQVDPMGIIASGNQGGSSAFQASGVSRAWSFGTSEARILSKIADRMEAIERQVFEIVLRWGAGDQQLGLDDVLFKGTVQYPEEFDLASTAQLIEERSQIGAIVNSPTLLRIMDKRIAASKVGDATAKDLKKIQQEIDANPLLGTMAGMTQTDPFGAPEFGEGDPDEGGAEGGGEGGQGGGGKSKDNGAKGGAKETPPRSGLAGVRSGGRGASAAR